MASTLVALILGAGPRVGAGVAKEFSKIGYKVALVSKSGSNSTTSEGYLSLRADLGDLNTIAGQAVDGWTTLAEGTKKAFVYTGNKINIQPLPVPATATLGMGKSASSYWISLADTLYQGKGARFFYADQRQADGNMGGMGLDGNAHGQFFVQLAQQEKDIPWLATFVPGTGYVRF
ncbi:short-chain dehydrogenase reductase SDR [Fusarium circinatum]|uniref:Short-chain dehydrogenase reductase SDR n=1 Tax=Fusarium circinatum TaxID=48490 RepID=A0A8H5WDS5_FUSCI|nr:short-chain dehydrogenase reductase SDR [Fusarium circinatum]